MVYVCPENDLQTCYRNLTFKVRKNNSEAKNRQNSQKQSKKNDNFQPSVAFNTVPLTLGYSSIHDSREGFLGVPVPNDYTIDEHYDNETDSLSPNLQYYLRDTFQSPSSLKAGKDDDSAFNSPPIKSPKLLKKRSDIKKIFLVSQNGKIVRRDYPSTPVIMNEALMVNKLDKNWNKLWRQRKAQINERLNEKKKWFAHPDIIFPKERIKPLYRGDDATPFTKEQRRKHKIFQQKVGYPNNPRTILCYISGRKHTWVALDWTLCKIAQDMDHIVVLATLPRLICNKKKGRKEDTEWASGYQKEAIDQRLSDVFEYILQLLKVVKASVKVTLEIVIGKTKKSLVDAINVHTPDVLVIATLKHKRNEKLVIYKSKKLADIFAVSFPIPVFIVPSKRMYSFELNLQRKMNEYINNSSSNSHTKNQRTDGNNTNDSPFENNELLAISSEISFDSFAEDFKRQNLINKHSNSSHESVRKKLLSVAKNSREKITGDLKTLHNDKQQQNHSAKDVKLTKIDIIIKESLKSSLKIDKMPGNDSSRSERNKKFADLKNSLIGNQSKGTEYRKSLIPYSPSQEQVNSNTIGPSTSPTSQIKFANTVKHKDGRAALGKVKNLPDMEHTKSSEEDNSTTDLPDNRSSVDNDISLRKVKSTGALRKVKSNDSSSSSSSRKSSSSYTPANAFTGGGVGIFRVFKSGSSSGNKSSSRRKSTGSEVLDTSDRSGKKKKKKKKSLFSVW
ncbi:hypothetical protein SUVZ_08G0650 [Saccharomyces uvarum]|uniref:UspA domain-containing protein n=1 Tax=Saccharomyces uvarum TaxID=230603 RepID=A0ABN8WWU0_SACUV|nr:hypothetical protein SUVZ_08G0650 [Saccharomyces uvarum]